MKRKQILAYAFLAFLVASQCHHSAGTVIQSAKSAKKLYIPVDSRLENAQPKFRSARYLLASWKSGTMFKDSIHKAPSGPSPIGNQRHRSSIHV
ncbi:CLAVATA3/ESR (CLE)-related protein [Salix suchowensis]|nr:CLAVATA3/ESR (CLE)-related protein [Salix suchowensis]